MRVNVHCNKNFLLTSCVLFFFFSFFHTDLYYFCGSSRGEQTDELTNSKMQVMKNNSMNNNSIPTSRSFTFADEDEAKDEINQIPAVVTPSKSRTGPVSPTSSDDNALSPSSLAYSIDSGSPVKKLQTIPTNNNAALLQTPPTASHSRVMLTPTKNISPSGMDDVHPLANMNTATINKTPILKEVDDKHPSLFANTVQINKHKISPEM